MLNGLDGCPDLEDSADAEPSVAAPENHHASQVTWLRGNDAGREAEAPETALPEVQASPVPKLRPAARAPAEQPRQSSFVAAAAVALFDLMERS